MIQGRPSGHTFGLRSRVGMVLGAAIVIPGLIAALPVSAAPAPDPTVTAAYSSTIGGPGHAEMYPSGMEIAPNGNLVVADTGNNQVAEYTPTGALVWRVGSEGSGAACGANPATFPQFEQPRDVGVELVRQRLRR